MIDYRLHVFRQGAEVRSLSKASKALHLSQPAVSKDISAREANLSIGLYRPIGRNVSGSPKLASSTFVPG
jgi:DNA-binding transcriptional LysR family regulator